MSRHHGHRTRGIVIVPRGATAQAAATDVAPFPPTPHNDLVFRGGRVIADLAYQNCYLGGYWATPAGVDDRSKVDHALAAALADAHLNNVVQQYFPGHPITVATRPPIVLGGDGSQAMTKSDVKKFAAGLLSSGQLAQIDLTRTVLNVMLAPGVRLSNDADPAAASLATHQTGLPVEETEDSQHGLGGYHGSIQIDGTPSTRLYYAVGVYSAPDASGGANGIPIPGWAPWENLVATFYHELNEARTDPDVEEANARGDTGLVGWSSDNGEEMGDFPIIASIPNLPRVFQRVALADGSGVVPVQFLYSNFIHAPQGPSPIPLVA